MKKTILIFALALCAAGNVTAKAQGTRLSGAARAFQTFFAKFKAALAKSDKTAIAGMTRFPFYYGFDAGDEGTMTRGQFIKRFSEIFGESPRSFVPEKNPLFSRDGSRYVVTTSDAAHLSFVKSGDGFKFTALMVEP